MADMNNIYSNPVKRKKGIFITSYTHNKISLSEKNMSFVGKNDDSSFSAFKIPTLEL